MDVDFLLEITVFVQRLDSGMDTANILMTDISSARLN